MKIIDYYTIVASDVTGFDTMVVDGIKHGWQPYGGIAMTSIPDESELDGQREVLALAMVKYAE